MKQFITFILLSVTTLTGFSQTSYIKGSLNDKSGVPIGYAPVVLLNPKDSTLAYFNVTNDKGEFEIKGARGGNYLLQITSIGYETYYREILLSEGAELGKIIMVQKPVSLGEVIVSEEYIPMRLKMDTVEYNTAAFKTNPGAVVEDLLKKLPGLDVDRAGNIKAMGEDVKRVLVDGKEFFGSDPKMATRNVPADALKKVQIFDKRSDESEFSGIDDGTRDKTLNLLLKEDRKDAIFGELLGGAGPGSYYQGQGKVYKFTKKDQFAALGMINNINQLGFSFRDYIDFNGGMQGMGDHGNVQIKIGGGGSSFPVNFGQPVPGLSTSGAGGLNFSREYKKDSRVFMSFLTNGSNRDLIETTSSRNFTDQNSFLQTDTLDEFKKDRTSRVNFGLRNRIDSTQNLIVNGSAAISYGYSENSTSTSVLDAASRENNFLGDLRNEANRFSGDISGSYMKKISDGKTLFKLASDASFSRNNAEVLWNNETFFSGDQNRNVSAQFQNNNTSVSNLSATASLTQKIGKVTFLEPLLKAGTMTESISRSQGMPLVNREKIDSLSPEFSRKYDWLRPGLRFIRNTDKTQFSLALQLELARTGNSLNNDNQQIARYAYFNPEFSWEYEYKTGRRLRAYYSTSVNTPSVNQLLPLVNNFNPLVLSSGNRSLKPELQNNLSLNWWIFDQFSFTTLLTNITGTYIQDKINWNRSIDENLMQTTSLINVPDDYRITGSIDFSTPIRKLGLKINTNIQESWNRGMSSINNTENTYTSLTQRFSASIENRKKTKADVIVGAVYQKTVAEYSIQKSMDTKYSNFSYYADLQYNPNKFWNFQIKTDVANYSADNFNGAVKIPLIGSEISYNFLKNTRGTLTLKGTDLLNRNTGVERVSELNFLREKRSNMLGRFFMISFKYRLNKFSDNSGGIDIKVNRR